MIPEGFKERMKKMLGDEFESFFRALTEGEAVRGLRVNPIKCAPCDFISSTSLPLTPISYYEGGYILEGDAPVGTLPEHHAGIIYMQDPGAMASLAAIDIPEGARVLDMCAAPGGKSGQAAAMIGESGFLLANEYVPKRAKIMVGNFERLGIRNAAVTSLDTSELKKLFNSYFDYVICDVPCSGEGMFRKSEEARNEWSPENVKLCAERSRGILENASATVKPGGYIIYSTCTWSIEENEALIHSFLSEHSNFSLEAVKDELKVCTADGISYLGEETEYLKACRRFYPHVSRGEGQFVALLRRSTDDVAREKLSYSDRIKPLSREEERAINSFFDDALIKKPLGRLGKLGDNIVLISHGAPPPPPSSVFMYGVLLGELKGKTLIPSHQFYSAYGELFKNRCELSGDAARLGAYLSGEEIDADEGAKGGFTVLLYRGAVIGGGKTSGGRIKNHYPKGLRN